MHLLPFAREVVAHGVDRHKGRRVVGIDRDADHHTHLIDIRILLVESDAEFRDIQAIHLGQ